MFHDVFLERNDFELERTGLERNDRNPFSELQIVLVDTFAPNDNSSFNRPCTKKVPSPV